MHGWTGHAKKLHEKQPRLHVIRVCVYCLLQKISLFLYEGVCYGGILVLLYVFVGLCFIRQIFNFWGCAICQRRFMMWKLMMFKIMK